MAYSKFKACDGDGHGYEGVDDGDNEDAFEFDDQDDHDDNDDGVEYDDHDDKDDQDDHDDAVEFDDQDEGWPLQTIWFQQIPTLADPEKENVAKTMTNDDDDFEDEHYKVHN